MQIRIRGTLGYATPSALDQALAIARHQVADENLASWLHSFERSGTTLRVDVELPVATDRVVAISVLEALADAAIDGVVELSRGDDSVDWFPANIYD
jgi:hypothetical protein